MKILKFLLKALLAAKIWGKIGDERTVEPLIETLRDDDYTVRISAVRDLWESGDERAVKPLLEALKDRDETVRKYAAGALEGIKRRNINQP